MFFHIFTYISKVSPKLLNIPKPIRIFVETPTDDCRESPVSMGFLWENAFDALDKIQSTRPKDRIRSSLR